MSKLKICSLDIETNSLLADMLDYSSLPYKLNSEARLWVVVIRDLNTNTFVVAENEEVTKEWMQQNLEGYDIILTHNGIKFDLVSLMLFGVLDYTMGYLEEGDTVFGKPTRFLDTLVFSRLLNPDRLGGHGLKAWGLRLGEHKTDYRSECIEAGYIDKSAPKGEEFRAFNPLMKPYCIQDTNVGGLIYFELVKEVGSYEGWKQSLKLEHKLADLAIRRETFGFWFDKELALECLQDLTCKMEELTNSVNPHLPLKKLTQTQANDLTPPKIQSKVSGGHSQAMIRFVENIGATLKEKSLIYEDIEYQLPLELVPLKTEIQATISDLDTVKSHLMTLGWNPSEWKERDLTKNSKKQSIPYDKRVKALDRWYKETTEGKYTKDRIEATGYREGIAYEKLKAKLKDNKPVRVLTSPSVRVGIEKELCPNLVSMGDKVAFAKDFVDYLTYRHRKSSIAGGDIEDMDFDSDVPNTGFLAMYREQDGRIPTPAIEIGASTHRYRHIGVANIPRASSIYGKEMRSMFGCGEGYVQLGFDFASLEARIQGHFSWNYTDGQQLAETLLAEKPNDIHTLTGFRLDIPRGDAKSVNYAILYGCSIKKIQKMLSCSLDRATEIFEGFWDGVPSLKELKQFLELSWIDTYKKYIVGIDGRKINIRSSHSILNACFQSAGVIAAKYSLVFIMEELESKGYCIDCFKGEPDVAEMISYHDESQLAVKQGIIKYEKFKTEEEAKEFVKAWVGKQLSAVSEGNVWYVALPNDISTAIGTNIDKAVELLKLNVPLGYEWIVSKNWYGCH